MRARADLFDIVDQAAGFITDASCACREASVMPLSNAHRHLLRRALAKLEASQADLWKLRNEPWHQPSTPELAQLSLL